MSYMKRLVAFFVFLNSTHNVYAGYIEKGSYLYPIMIDIRHKKYDEAMGKLEPYVKQGDSDALFWFGYMKQQNHGRDRYSAYEWFEQAAKLGNPYGMYKLSGDGNTNDVCNMNGWTCDTENLEHAVKIWDELADEGDVRAQYYSEYYSRSVPSLWFDSLTGKEVDRIRIACERGYCRPLRDLFFRALDDGKHSKEDWGDDLFSLIVDFTHNDPAIAAYRANYAYEGLTDKERVELIVDSLKKGYYPAAGLILDLAVKDKVVSYEDAYVYSLVASMGGVSNPGHRYLVEKGYIEEAQEVGLRNEAKVFFDEIDHVINFDEMDFMFMFKPDV